MNSEDKEIKNFCSENISRMYKDRMNRKKESKTKMYLIAFLFLFVISFPFFFLGKYDSIGYVIFASLWPVLVLIILGIINKFKMKRICENFYKIKNAHTKFNIINVTKEEKVKQLYDHSALTYVSPVNKYLLDYLYNFFKFEHILKNDDNINVYTFSGKLLNDTFNIYGYEDTDEMLCIDIKDLNIDSENYDFYRDTNSRWLDDMVDNCKKRKGRKNNNDNKK